MQDNAEFWNKYYSKEAQGKMAARRKKWTPELEEHATAAWTELFRDVEAALGEDPASERAQALAARWRKLVEGFTGGDADVSAGLKKVWADRQHWPATMQQQAAPFMNQKVWEFMGKAMACSKGLMKLMSRR